MSITPQTNVTLEEIADTLKRVDNICICGHVNPDGDCIGSALSLYWGLKALDKQVVCLLVQDDPAPINLQCLPGVDTMVYAGDFAGQCDTFVAVDVPTPERLGSAKAIQAQASTTITIDHHAVDETMSQLSYTDSDAASTTMLIWELLAHMGVDRDVNMATCAYMGLMTDTGRFQYQNTTVDVFTAAASMVSCGAHPGELSEAFYQNRSLASVELEGRVIDRIILFHQGEGAVSYITHDDMVETGATKADTEPLIDVIRSIQGVRVAAILRDQGAEIRGSLRSKDETNVAEIARSYNGGGHKAAAGFTLYEPIGKAVSTIQAAIDEALSLGVES